MDVPTCAINLAVTSFSSRHHTLQLSEESTMQTTSNPGGALENSEGTAPRFDDDDDDWETLDAVAVPNCPVAPVVLPLSVKVRDAIRQTEPKSALALDGLDRCRPSSKTASVPMTASTPALSLVGRTNHRRSNTSQAVTSRTPSIVTHPMQHIGLSFAWHLVREIWATDVTFRLALACFVAGATARTIEWSLWYVLYPERLVWSVTLLLGVGIPAYFHYQPRLEAMMRTLQSSELPPGEVLCRCLDTNQLRWLMAIWWFVVPAILELRTLQFLTHLVSGSTAASCAVVLSLAGRYLYDVVQLQTTNETTSHDYFKLLASRKYTQFGLYGLYGTALVCTLCHGALPRKHLPSLAARFLLSTGVLLYQSSTSDSSLVVRNALRYTVRDALQQVGTSVQQDELLQLTMLRWIVDFWSSQSPKETSPAGRSKSVPSSGFAPPEAPPSSAVGRTPPEAPRSHRSTRPSEVLQFRQPELDWSDLCPMLQTTTRQMNSEVSSLQHHSESVVSQTLVPSVALTTGGQSSRPAATGSSSTNHSTRTGVGGSSGSVQSLQAMLSSMNLDEQAQPAVLAYKDLVYSFPPSRRTAIVLGTCRCVPAIVLLSGSLIMCLFGLHCRPLTWSMVLFPFVLFEALRIRFWVEACCEVSGDLHVDQQLSFLLDTVDPMTLLLMDESYHETNCTPPLLLVWRNVYASVEALEVSLTTARCVQTTVVAADFAANVISLASFGLEVSRHGWLHGLSIVAKELLHLQSSGTDVSTLWHGVAAPEGSSYTSAAVSVVRNSQTISRNMQVLSREGATHGAVVGQTLGFLAVLVGHGWFWGRDEEQTPTAEASPTIQIVEIDDENADIQQEADGQTMSNQCSLDFATTLEVQVADVSVESSDSKEALLRSVTENNMVNDANAASSANAEVESIEIPISVVETASSDSVDDVTSRKSTRSEVESNPHVETIKETTANDAAKRSCESVLDSGVETLEFGPIEGGALSVSSDDECPVDYDVHVNAASSCGSWDDTDDFRKVDDNGCIAGGRIEEREMESIEVSKNADRAEEDDNLWLKVGGGLAVFGAVVAGSVALLASNNGNKNTEHKKKQDGHAS